MLQHWRCVGDDVVMAVRQATHAGSWYSDQGEIDDVRDGPLADDCGPHARDPVLPRSPCYAPCSLVYRRKSADAARRDDRRPTKTTLAADELTSQLESLLAIARPGLVQGMTPKKNLKALIGP